MGQSDRHVENARMNPENQAWQPLDPATGSLPGEIESALGDGDSVSACVVILVDSEIDRDWGAQASVAVAKRWAASGRRIILADACLDGPVLHEAVGAENGEGVSDMVLYGASAKRITERVEGGFMLAPAGTPVIEVADVLKHVKWDTVIRGCREAGATLVFHVSTGTPGVEAMTKRAEGVLVLASPSKDVDAILGSESGRLIAVLGPANGDVPSVDGHDEEGDVASVDVLPGPPVSEAERALVGEASLEAPISDAERALVGEASPEAPVSDAEKALVGEASPAPPVSEAERALVGEPGPPEDEAPAAFSTDDLPKTTDAFSLSGLKGAQYDSEDSPEVGLDPGQAPPSQPDEAEVGVSLDVEPTALVDDGRESADVESTGAGVSDVGDLAAVDLGMADTADSGSGAAAGVEEPAPASGAPAELDAEDSPAAFGVEASPVDFSVAASPTEERGEADEAEGKARGRYRGLARLRWRKRREVLIRLVLITLATSVVGGGGFYAIAYSGLINIPGITPDDRIRTYVPPPEALPGPTPQTAIMTHVLFIDSWSEIGDAWAIRDALRGRLPTLLFFVTPLDVDGRSQFVLYAGPAYGAVEATALREPIAVAMTDRENPDDWEVRDRQYAFYFGEYESTVNAQGRVEALARASIPAYSLQVAYADGSSRVRVYGGAFRDEVEAEEMGRMINAADIGALVLTPRRGTLPE